MERDRRCDASGVSCLGMLHFSKEPVGLSLWVVDDRLKGFDPSEDAIVVFQAGIPV